MSFGFSDMTPEGKKYFAELEKLSKLEVAVGFQEGIEHIDRDGNKDGATVAEIAAYNELGTSTSPARPFMKQSFENHEKELQASCDQVYKTLSNGGTTGDALAQLGVYLKGLVQDEIVNGGFEPNAAATIERKGSSTPLIDSGNMRQSVNYMVRDRTD